MKKYFAKFIATILTFSIIVSMCGIISFAYESETALNGKEKNTAFILESLGVIENESEITRGLFAASVEHLLYEEGYSASANFRDVPAYHKYSNEIARLGSMGIINGDGNGNFLPDNNIKLQEAISIAVNALGYKEIAANRGTWTNGYYSVAVMLNLYTGIDGKGDEALSYNDYICLMYNICEAQPLIEYEYIVENTEYRQSGFGLLDRKLSRMNLEIVEGVLSNINNEKVTIGSKVYVNKSSMGAEFLGYKVIAIKDRNTGVIKAGTACSVYNEVLELGEDEIVSIDFNKLVYEKGKNKTETIDISDFSGIVKNGTALNSVGRDDISLVNGKILLIDNDRDMKYDFLNIISAEYFTIERLSTNTHIITAESGMSGENVSIYFDTENEDVYHIATDAEGNSMKLENLEKGDSFRLINSKDGKRTELKLLEEETLESFEMMDNSDGIVLITKDGTEYGIAKKADGTLIVDESKIILGKEYNVVFDEDLIVRIEELENKENIGFVAKAERVNSGLGNQIEYLILAEDRQLYIGKCADYVKYNGKKTKSSNINIKTGIPIYYTIDEEGKISSITEFEQYGEKELRKWVEDTSIFKSSRYRNAVYTTDDTKFFVVPESGENEDYLSNIKLVDKQMYTMTAFGYNEDTHAVDAVVIYSNITYDTPGTIGTDDIPVMLIKSVGTTDKDGFEGYRLTYLEKNEEKQCFVKSTDTLNAAVESMKKGDVFRYSVNGAGYIDNIEVLLRVKTDDTFHKGAETAYESVYGYVESAWEHTLPKGSLGRFAEVVELIMTDGESREFLIHSEDEIPYYLYLDGEIKVGSFDDIIEDAVGIYTSPSKVFVFYIESETAAVAIINEGSIN